MGHSLKSRIGWLDGLRGIAVVLVVWYHATIVSGWLPHVSVFGYDVSVVQVPSVGFTGVELFFFISGFALFYPYARNLFEGTELHDLPTFAWRRFIKIVPSYLVVLVALALFGGVAFKSAYDLFWTMFVHLAFILSDQDWHPFGQINGVLWSLSVEVQFYVIFPLLALVMRRYPWATWIVCCTVAWVYRMATFWIALKHPAFKTQVPGYLDLFASGMLAAYLCIRFHVRLTPSKRLTAIGTATALGGVLLTVALLNTLWEDRAVTEWRDVWSIGGRLALSLAFILIALGSTFAARWWQLALGNPVLVFLSVISYNLYLWHHFIFLLLAHAYPDISRTVVFEFLSALVALGVATFLTYFFERPLLRLDPPWQRKPAAEAETQAEASGA